MAQAIDLLYSAAYDASGVGSPVLVGRNRALALTLTVDAPLAPGTLDVAIETAGSAQATTWRALGAFPQVTDAGSSSLALDGADVWVRARYTVGAEGSFGLSLSGTAALTVLAAASRTSSGTGPTVDLQQYRSARLTLSVSALSAGTLDVTVETAGTVTASTWRTVATFPLTRVTAPADVDVAAVSLDRFVRIRWALSTGGSATFDVSGVARLVLATPADRARLGVASGAFPALSAAEVDDLLLAATADVLGVYAGRYEMPLRAWGDDTRKACIAIADWAAICKRGTEPGVKIEPASTVYYERYAYYCGTLDRPGGWLARVARKDPGAIPSDIVDSAPPTLTGQKTRIEVASDPPRGWGRRYR